MSRVAVVTGGASGMGQSIVQRLAADGDRVAILDLNGEAAEKLAAELQSSGASAMAVEVDVADPESVGAVRSEFGPIQILVTSAAIAGFTPFRDITLDQWNRYLAVNLTGTFLCLQAALPDMVDPGWGRVVTISSAAAQSGAARQGHYSASKGGVISLTRTLALEYAGNGITVNTVPPFTVDTPMLRAAQDAGDLLPSKYLAKAAPVGRLGQARTSRRQWHSCAPRARATSPGRSSASMAEPSYERCGKHGGGGLGGGREVKAANFCPEQAIRFTADNSSDG